jgi:muramoyltetrapeptide carboxypeptidase
MEMFEDPEVSIIQALRGGFGAAQVVPLLDFEAITKNPKLFIGFSDLTALHTALLRRCGLATIYGPGLIEVGRPNTSEFTKDRLLRVVSSDATGIVPPDPDDSYVRTISPGKVTAPFVGGCLQLLTQTVGTPWEFDASGAILFFEDVDMPPWYVDGMLTQLHQAGKFRDVVGVVVGEMVNCDWRRERPEWPRTKSLEDVLEEHLLPLGVPVLYKLPLGHGRNLAAVPLGITATLDADARSLSILKSPFEPTPA